MADDRIPMDEPRLLFQGNLAKRGHWFKMVGLGHVRLSCPACGQVLRIPQLKTINKDGTVRREVICINCDWFGRVKLEGWEPG